MPKSAWAAEAPREYFSKLYRLFSYVASDGSKPGTWERQGTRKGGKEVQGASAFWAHFDLIQSPCSMIRRSSSSSSFEGITSFRYAS